METFKMLRMVLQTSQSFTLVIRGGEFFLNARRLPKESLRYAGLVDAFETLGLYSVEFLPQVSLAELTQFMEAAFVPDTRQQEDGRARPHVTMLRLPNIRLNAEDLAQQLGGEEEKKKNKTENVVMRQARETYKQAVDVAMEAQYDTYNGGTVNVQLTTRVVDMLQDGILSYADAYFALSQLREFSEYTYYHSVNVAIISMLLGKGIGLDREAVGRLGLAAMLHDLGKVFVPHEILDKPGRLDEKEREVMETHPLDSVRILLDQKDVAPASISVASQHHTGYDMKGYPKFEGIDGLHLFSHICTIADVYDALRSARSYKPAMLPDKSMEILLEGSGKTFHPTLLKAFFRMVGFFPVGSAVELNTGEFAVVASNNPLTPMQPVVKIVAEEDGREKDKLANLAEASAGGGQYRSVLRSVDPNDYGLNVAEHLSFAQAS